MTVVGLMAAAIGCGDSNLAVVTGSITYQGAPVSEGTVTFLPADDGGRSTTADIQADGTYRLRYSKSRDALPVGDYTVTVTAVKQTYAYTPEEFEAGTVSRAQLNQPPEIEWLVPEKYSDPDQSGLKATVDGGYSSYDFDLE